jgi:hypothetical protein
MAGEVWFKVDRGDAPGVAQVNGSELAIDKVQRNLASCLALAPTWVQTCWFAYDGESPSTGELDAYCELLRPFAGQLGGIHLYGLARPSMQAMANRLGRLSPEEMAAVAASIQRKTGIRVLISP